MLGKAAGLAVLGAAVMAPGVASAEIESVHVGVLAHNICVTDCKNADKEDGPVIEGQVNFSTPGFLEWAFNPQPYIVGSLNVAGDTSFVGAGLEWSWQVSDSWSVETGVGYVIHDGETNLPYPAGSPEAAEFTDNHVLLGSRDLFRTSLGVTYEMNDRWEIQGFFSHLSHGQILGNGRNQGMDQAGVRVGYNF